MINFRIVLRELAEKCLFAGCRDGKIGFGKSFVRFFELKDRNIMKVVADDPFTCV